MVRTLHRVVSKRFAYCTLAALFLTPCVNAYAQTSTPSYTWGNVKIVAGGYVDGIVAHPAQQGLFYARTDIGGAYRYNAANATWTPLNDWTSPSNNQWMGIESLAIDPSNPKMLYLVAGLYTQQWWDGNGAVLVSSDQGATFTAHPLSFRVGGNDDGRQVGERLQVDPNLGSTLLYGTFNDASQAATNGLWKSVDSGSTWNRVSGFTALSSDGTGAGVAFVAFYKPSGTAGSPTRTIFAGVSTSSAAAAGATLYKSVDGGNSWTPVAGGPTGLMPQRGLIGPDGNLYVTYGDAIGPNGMKAGAVWKYGIASNLWQNITPPDPYHYPSGFSGLALDPSNPGTLIVATMDHWWPQDTMYRSTNGGTSWTDVGALATRDASLAPWIKPQGQSQPNFGNWAEAVIDPFNPAHSFYTFGGGIWATSNLTAADRGQATNWTVGSMGIEETAVLALLSPTSGVPLISGLGDVCGFVHTSLTAAPTAQFSNPGCGNTNALDYAKNMPSTIVRVGSYAPSGAAFGAVSHDGGSTWTPFASQAGSTKGGGSVAVSADASMLVWAPSDIAPAYSNDNGTTWTSLAGKLPTGVQVLSDSYNASLMYAWNAATGAFYVSSDKGANWLAPGNLGLPANGRMSTVPGIGGELWLATSTGLYKSTTSGWSWSRFGSANISSANSIGFGKAAQGKWYPTMYLAGTVNGVTGLFRSTDSGTTWVQINDAKHQWGGYSFVVGDPKTFGTVYVAPASGRGVIYGTSAN